MSILRILPMHRLLRVAPFVCLLVAISLPAKCRAQTVLEVPQAVVFRNSGSVQVTGKDGVVRDAYAGPVDASLQPKDETSEQKAVKLPPANGKTANNHPLKSHVFSGETVTVGQNGSADLVLTGAGSVRMQPDSKVKLTGKIEGKSVEESLELLKGKLFLNIDGASIKRRDKQEFRLKTPTAILAVKGTSFFAEALEKGETIGVHKGSVSVTVPASKEMQLIQAGRAMDIAVGKLSTERALNADEQALSELYSEIELIAASKSECSITTRIVSFRGLHNPDLRLGKSDVLVDWNLLSFERGDHAKRGGFGSVIPPLGKNQAGSTATGFSVECRLNGTKLQPVAVEFAVSGDNINAFRVLPPVSNTEGDPFSSTPKFSTRTQLPYDKQPFWSGPRRGSNQGLLPATWGFSAEVGKDTGKDAHARKALLDWNAIAVSHITAKGAFNYEHFYVITYLDDRDYVPNGLDQQMKLYISDIRLLIPKAKK